MKKLVPIILAIALTAGVIITAITLLNKQQTVESQEIQPNIVTGASNDSNSEKIEQPTDEQQLEEEIGMDEPLPDFFIHEQQKGVVEALENGNFQIAIENGEEMYTFMWSSQSTKVIDNTGNNVTLEDGQSITFTAYTSTKKPRIMIYPPSYTPDVLIVQTEKMGFADFTKLDANYVNESGTIRYNIDETVEIESLTGDNFTISDIVGKSVIVFYDVTTRSVPAQANPSKVLVLNIEQ